MTMDPMMAVAVLSLQGLICGIWHFEPLRLMPLISLHLLESPQAIELPTTEREMTQSRPAARDMRSDDYNDTQWGGSGWTCKERGGR